MIVTAALTLLLLTAVLQLYFYLRFFRHALRMHTDPEPEAVYRTEGAQPAPLPLSVVICARNEARGLHENLPYILEQVYEDGKGQPAFEVIVVNDSSTDESAAVLQRFEERFPQLNVISVAPDAARAFPGKKFPLSLGVAAARHEIIVCTDADCRPATASWLHIMAAPFRSGKSIVAGYGGYRRYPGWLNWFIRMETMHTFFLYYCFWKGGAPYMAVGRNMAFRKALFLHASQTPQWSALPSGDDDLLIQRCATRDNMCVIAHPAAATWSEPKRTVDEYLMQKTRHVSTGKYYKRQSKVLLGLYAFMQLLSLLAPLLLVLGAARLIAGEINGGGWIVAHAAAALTPYLLLHAQQQTARRLGDPAAGRGSWMAFSFCWLAYNTVLAPWILWKTKQRWT